MKRFRPLDHINKNLTVRVFVYLMAAILLVAGSMSYYHFWSRQRELRTEMIREGRLLVEVVAQSARLGIFAEDPEQIKTTVQSAFRVDGVLEVCVYNTDIKLLTMEFNPRRPAGRSHCTVEKGMDPEILGKVAASQTTLYFEDPVSEVIEFWSPVRATSGTFSNESLFFEQSGPVSGGGRIIGFIGICVDQRPLQQRLRGTLSRSLLLFAGALVLGAVVTSFIVREVTRPLNQLVGNIKGYGIEVDTADQLGALAGTFDSLVSQLGGAFATINELRRGLEQKVAELEQEVAIRKQAEQDLLESEETARVLLNVPINASALLDVHGTILDANQAMAERLGLDMESLAGNNIWDLLAVDDTLFRFRGRIEAAVAAGRNLRFEGEHGERYFDYAVYPIVDAHNRPTKMAVLARDISRRVEAEKKRQELEVKSLTQAKLASLGQISTGIAHEINQPLSFIRVIYESTLRDFDLGRVDMEELRDDFREALRQVSRISALTGQLRTFGRPDTDIFEPVALPAVLDKTMILMGERMRRHNIDLRLDTPSDLPLVRGNANKLEQVFINLLQNAMDAMELEQSGKVMVEMFRDGSHRVTTTFSDSGPGISTELQGKIFEPFFTTKEVDKGTGLGLAIVYGIIREHHGSIRYEPVPGGAGRFVFTLPVAAGTEKEIPP
ncbi:MAG: ATP-binding protein [Desulfobacterales bacterium]|nr:ATP-binding protein [Desulfobacterales bacterium]